MFFSGNNLHWSDHNLLLGCFADKAHVTLQLSFVNVPALNILLRSEVFVGEDGQLQSAPLILDYEPLSKIFQEAGQAIKVGDSWLAHIDVSVPRFLAQRDLPLVRLPSRPALPEVPAAPREEVGSSRLTLEDEIDEFHFKEEEKPVVLLFTISDGKGESDRSSSIRSPILVIARPNSSSKEEEEVWAWTKAARA